MQIPTPDLNEGEHYHIVQGKRLLTIEGKVFLLALHGYEYTVTRSTSDGAAIEHARGDDPGRGRVVYRTRVSIDEIGTGDKSRPAWRKHPQQMLVCRAISGAFDFILKDDAAFEEVVLRCLAQ